MYCHIFLAFFLLLLISFHLCGQGCAASQAQEQTATGENIEFLKPGGTINANFKSLGEEEATQITVKSIESVNFVAVNGVMVALAEVIKSIDDQINLLAKFYEIEEGDGWGTNAVKEEENKWKVQLVAEKLGKKEDTTVMKSSVVVAENTIFYYRFNSDNKLNQISASVANNVEWKLKLFEGKITPESGTGKIIKWTNTEITASYSGNKLKELLNTQPATIAVTNIFAFVTGNKKYIFLVLNVPKAAGGSSDKYIIAVFQLEGNGSGKTLKFFAESVLDCHPSFFQWGEKIIMTPTDESNCNSQNVMVFNEEGNIFTESKNPIAHLRDFLKDKNFFFNATIEGINALLFIQQKTNEDGDGKNAHLWMTDGSRVSLA